MMSTSWLPEIDVKLLITWEWCQTLDYPIMMSNHWLPENDFNLMNILDVNLPNYYLRMMSTSCPWNCLARSKRDVPLELPFVLIIGGWRGESRTRKLEARRQDFEPFQIFFLNFLSKRPVHSSVWCNFLSPGFLRKLRGFSKSFAYVGSVAKGNIG